MTMNSIFESAIKEHVKEDEFFSFIKGLKVIKTEHVKTIPCFNDTMMMTKYLVTCSYRAKKYDNNRVNFEINLYSDGSEIGVYFAGTFYQD